MSFFPRHAKNRSIVIVRERITVVHRWAAVRPDPAATVTDVPSFREGSEATLVALDGGGQGNLARPRTIQAILPEFHKSTARNVSVSETGSWSFSQGVLIHLVTVGYGFSA